MSASSLTAASSSPERRRRQRGAIFVEAVIVVTMLTIMFASAVFFHSLYANEIRATRDARLAAWQQAEEGCPTTLGVAQLLNLISIDNCQDESCSVGGLNTASETGPDWLESGAKVGEVTRTVTADERIGARTYSLQAYNRVICNERHQNERGDLLSIGEYILDAVIQ